MRTVVEYLSWARTVEREREAPLLLQDRQDHALHERFPGAPTRVPGEKLNILPLAAGVKALL